MPQFWDRNLYLVSKKGYVHERTGEGHHPFHFDLPDNGVENHLLKIGFLGMCCKVLFPKLREYLYFLQ